MLEHKSLWIFLICLRKAARNLDDYPNLNRYIMFSIYILLAINIVRLNCLRV